MSGNIKKTKSLFTQILIVFLLFTIAIYGLWRINLIKLPDFIENILSSEQTDGKEYADDGFEIFEYISDEQNIEIDSLYPQISIDNLQSILLSIEPYDNFYWETTSEVISGTGKHTKICRSRISGDKYNIELLDNKGNTTKKCISDGNKSYIIQYNGNTKSSYIYSKGIVDFYSDSGIISVDYFKNHSFDNSNCEIRTVAKDNLNLVSISYTLKRNGVDVRNNFLLSLDYGVVLYAETLENDKSVYRLTTTSVYPLDSLDDELFTVD